jgi:hypothetical protein
MLQNKSLYGREQNHESQFHGFALNPFLEFMVLRRRLEQIKIVTLIEFLNILFRTFTGK